MSLAPHVCVCAMDQAYFSKTPAKICNLRTDTLAIMLSQANVQAHARVCPHTHLSLHVTQHPAFPKLTPDDRLPPGSQ